MVAYAGYFPAGATVSKVLRVVRAIPNEQAVWNHYWFEAYIKDFLLENYNKNQTIVHGCLLSESATDVIACTGGEVIIDGVKTTVATPSNVNVAVDGWTVLYIDVNGALISTIGTPLNNANIQGANAPDSAILVGFAKRTSINFDVYPIQNFLDLRVAQQLVNSPIFIGDQSQVTSGTAKYTINTLPVTSVSDTLVFIDGAVNTLTADRTINCHAVMQSPKGSIDTAGFKLTLSGAKAKTSLIVTNAVANKVEITGLGSEHQLISDNDASLNVTVQSVVVHNGNLVTDNAVLELASEAEGAAGVEATKAMPAVVSRKSQTAARNEGVVVKNHATNGVYQLDVVARRMTLFEDVNNTLRHIQNLSVTVDITVNGINGCPRVSRTGTITSGGTAVTGVGTLFTAEYIVGDVLWADGSTEGRRIVTITNDINIVLASAYTTNISVASSITNGGEAPDTTYWLWAATTGTLDGAFLSTRGPDDTAIHIPSGYTHVEWINLFNNLPTGNLEVNESGFQTLSRLRAYELSNIWHKPKNLSYIRVRVQGAGGGGSSGNSTNTGGGGGGAGGYSEKLIKAGDLSDTETITVGSGGGGKAGNAQSGSAGGTSSFGSHCSATGGQPPIYWWTGAPGGIGSGGDINCKGGGGGATPISWNIQSEGGQSILGGGPGREDDDTRTGFTGGSYGGGGTGTKNIAAQSSGSGAAGVIIIEEF